MITYTIKKFDDPIYLHPGDKFQLSVDNEIVHVKEITFCDTITHWAYIEIPEIGAAYFVGNEKLESFIIERFPDAERK